MGGEVCGTSLYLRDQFRGNMQLACLDIHINIADGAHAALSRKC
jgi:hypothetical protein